MCDPTKPAAPETTIRKVPPSLHSSEARRDDGETAPLWVSHATVKTDGMTTEDKQPKPGDMVVLVGLPPGFLDDLPLEEQSAISAMVGKPIQFIEFSSVTWRGER